jgi:hypothetical protein
VPIRLCLPLASLAVVGCASAPLSFIVGDPQTRTDQNLFPVRVVSVDRKIYFNTPNQPVQIAPGPRSLVLEATGGSSARGAAQRTYVLNIEPCTRYYLVAKRAGRMEFDWELHVERKETVGGCDPDEQRRKFAAK